MWLVFHFVGGIKPSGGNGRFRADANAAAAGGGGTVRVLRVEERLGSAHMCSVCSWPPGEPHGAGPRIVRAARLKPQRVSLGESQPAEGGEGCRSRRERGWVRGLLLRFSPSSAACLMFRDETEAWLHLKTLKRSLNQMRLITSSTWSHVSKLFLLSRLNLSEMCFLLIWSLFQRFCPVSELLWDLYWVSRTFCGQ